MTDKRLIYLNNRVQSLHNRLSCELQELSRAASDRLGYDVVADICNGGEVEFRRIMKDGVPDAYSCIRIEDILSKG